MSTSLADLGHYLKEHADQSLQDLTDQVYDESAAYRSNQGKEGIYQTFRTSLLMISDALISGSTENIISRLSNVGADRAHEGYLIEDVLLGIRLLRELIWDQLERCMVVKGDMPIVEVRLLERMLHLLSRTMMVGYSQTFQQTIQAVEKQAAEIEAQRYTIREIGTPILPLYPGVIALPLVGAIDSYRATQVLERLLEEISAKQADIVIIDITGVPVVDTGVANYLLQTARAAQLIGAQVVLVGIGAEIAQTLVQLGVNLSQLKVHATLQDGIRYALQQLGFEIRAIS
ncbi:STAS domain-containing protein [Candidatus Oscillochloris fontis]|uniref:STAS domain-containing protein n=1 Tax=Candidatus Oscillochloris fontis TaxID=2496868 RepID=UPI00193111CB|nr:STAS domain-containing protein [Candidatus Oscillochloris fontis]